MRTLFILLSLLLLGVSGCLEENANQGRLEGEAAGPDGGSSTNPEPPSEGEPPSGSPDGHGAPTVSEGPVESTAPSAAAAMWSVAQTISIDNDFGGASFADVLLEVAIGSIDVAPSPDGDYHYTLILEGHGGTEAQAQQAFDYLEWNHDDVLSSGTLALSTWIRSNDPEGNGVSCSGVGPLVQCSGRMWSGHIEALVPNTVSYDLSTLTSTADVSTSSLHGSRLGVVSSTGEWHGDKLSFATIARESSTGETYLSNLECDELNHRSTTGDVRIETIDASNVKVSVSTADVHIANIAASNFVFDGSTSELTLEGGRVTDLRVVTSTGDQDYDIEFVTAILSGSTAEIGGRLTPLASGSLDVSTSTGDVEFEFPAGGAHGYDVSATTNTGDFDITVTDGETLEDSDVRAHQRTKNFEDRAIRTTVSLTTSTGDITVEA